MKRKSKEKKLISALNELTTGIISLVESELASKSISAGTEDFFQWKVKDFKYTNKGIETGGATGGNITKESWFRASRDLSDKIVKFKEFDAVEKIIKADNLELSVDSKFILRRFSDHLLSLCLGKSKSSDKNKTDDLIKRFIRDLNDEPINTTAIVDLYGMVLESKKIKLSSGISFRQTKKEDLEILTRLYGLKNSGFLPDYTAVLKIDSSFTPKGINKLQIKVEKCVVLLRLFRVGTVWNPSYKMSSDAVANPFSNGTITAGQTRGVNKPYLIKKIDEKALRYFFNKLPLPEDVYSFNKKFSHITCAFDRYSEALLESSSHERKIANVVMGLEALFSRNEPELTFKLSTRVSKIMSFFEDKPLFVRDALKKAYSVRSTFSHGGHLDEKDKKKIESEYGSLDNFLFLIANYLRVGLVVMINYGHQEKNKNDLIKLVDDSLIEDEKSKELGLCFKKIKPFIQG